MELLIRQMLRASEDGLYFAALTLALAIPDMLGALQSENGRASGSKYRRWAEEHLLWRGAGEAAVPVSLFSAAPRSYAA